MKLVEINRTLDFQLHSSSDPFASFVLVFLESPELTVGTFVHGPLNSLTQTSRPASYGCARTGFLQEE